MTPQPTVGVSACLVGQRVRYDGGHRLHDWVTTVLARSAALVPFCPELEMGLGVPRPKIRRVGDGLFVIGGARVEGAAESCEQLIAQRLAGVDGVILKSRSPSCGLDVDLYDRRQRGAAPTGRTRGLFARALLETWPDLPVCEEARLPAAGPEFLRQIRDYHARRAP